MPRDHLSLGTWLFSPFHCRSAVRCPSTTHDRGLVNSGNSVTIDNSCGFVAENVAVHVPINYLVHSAAEVVYSRDRVEMNYRKAKNCTRIPCLSLVVALAACAKKVEPPETRQALQVASASLRTVTDTLARAVDSSGAAKLRIDASPDFGVTAHSAGTSVPKTAGRMKQYATTPDSRLGRLAPGYGIPVEQLAPNASLKDADGHSVHLLDFTKSGAILLVFYRGGWCPYCSFEIHELTANYGEYKKRNVTPVAVSVDRPEEASKSRTTFNIPFPVLSDPDLAALQAYHVVHEADEAEIARLKRSGIDMEHASGRNHHSYAVPSLFLIDRTNRVRWVHTDPDYKVRPSTQQILSAIDATGLANEMAL